MREWWAAVMVGWLSVGCGEPVREEVAQAEMPAAEASEVAAQACAPVAGEAQRVKVILPPSSFPARLAEMPESFVEFQGQLFFAVNFADGRRTLWKSDGTEAGTVEVYGFAPLPFFSFSRLRGLTPVADKLFFEVTDATTGNELWVTDGTTGGTHLVADLSPGIEDSFLSHLTGLGTWLVFIRELSGPPGGYEVWRSDGTTAGTVRLSVLPNGNFVSGRSIHLGNTLLFFVTHPTNGTDLWKTDGTVAGTARVRRLDSSEAFPFDVRTAGGTAFFTLFDDGNMTEVWRTDGTPGGTHRMRTFGPATSVRLLGALGGYLYLALTDVEAQRLHVYRMPLNTRGGREYVTSLPNPYADQPDAFPGLSGEVSAADGRIYFTVFIGSPGPAPRDTQLWVTDGTAAGTRLLRRPLSLSDEYSSPVYAVHGQLAFFSAPQEGGFGIEPWLTDGTVGGTRRLRDIAPGGESSYPGTFLRVGSRVFFNAYDETLAGQLWSVPLLSTCAAGAR